MKNNYQTLLSRKAYLLLFFLMIVSVVFAQTETEPNNTATDTGTQRVWEGTTITGTVSSTDTDFWNVSKLPGLDPQNIMVLGIGSGVRSSYYED